ncbi:MAG: hypothetical protein QOF57_1447, partial [Frankiaceae bacterium]|nr:hypothetical protein [Frankiaceae bacterium]
MSQLRQGANNVRLSRRAVSVFAAGVLAMTGAASLTVLAGHASAAGTQLFPNLQTLPPRDLRFADANVSSDPNVTTTHRVLQFSNTVTNSGAGRLEVRAHIDSTLNPPSGPAYERVYDTAGGYTDYPVGSMYYHAVHGHYHYEGWGVYQLWTKSDYDNWLKSGRTTGNPKWVGSKTTSCIIDEEFIRTLPGTPYPGQYGGGGCQLDSGGNLVEGLSPGWGDTYDWYRFEQWIDIGPAGSSLADGAYVLRSVTDPNNQIYESAGKSDTTVESAADNEATTVFTVSGSQILDTDAPTGTLAINHVAASTSVANVTASVIGRDDVSGVKAFRLSNDGTTWSPQIAYTSSASVATDASWSLTDSRYGGTAATGTKTVYAQFLDNSGKWGPSTTDTIVYGTVTTSQPPPPPPPTSAYSSAVSADGPAGYWRLGETSGTGAA